jgi:hypothetical protein
VTIADVEEQVRDTYWDWRGLLVNPRYCREGLRVSWNRYAVGIIREPITYEKVRSLVETKQFSFQCAEDGSVFQLLYQFASDDDLQLARLAFYKAHVPLGEAIESSGPLPTFDDEFIPWMRFDYTSEHAAGVLHHESHLHISGFPGTRLAVSGVPGPRQFIEFVFASCYPDYYRTHRLKEDGTYTDEKLMKQVNVCCRQDKSKDIANRIIHLQVP